MATFISTVKFTQKGLDEITESTKRAAAFKAAAKKMGVKVTGTYWTTGHFDGVLIFDAPDDETATAAMMHLAGQGYVHTTTARAFEAAKWGRSWECWGSEGGRVVEALLSENVAWRRTNGPKSLRCFGIGVPSFRRDCLTQRSPPSRPTSDLISRPIFGSCCRRRCPPVDSFPIGGQAQGP